MHTDILGGKKKKFGQWIFFPSTSQLGWCSFCVNSLHHKVVLKKTLTNAFKHFLSWKPMRSEQSRGLS